MTHACFYEPELNATYQDFATHYGTAILPTRVAKPRDKAKAEGGVLIIEREVMAPLRDHRFTSLAQLNAAITERLEIVNTRRAIKLGIATVYQELSLLPNLSVAQNIALGREPRQLRKAHVAACVLAEHFNPGAVGR